MQTNRETRRDRLRLLCDEAGGQSALASLIDKDRRQVSAWLADPAKPGAKAMSDATAREIEGAAHKPAGWLDVNQSGTRTENSSRMGQESQRMTLDEDILHEAITLLLHDEMQAGVYPPRAKTRRLVELYEWIAAEGGRLSASSNREYERQVLARQQGVVSGGATRKRGIDRD